MIRDLKSDCIRNFSEVHMQTLTSSQSICAVPPNCLVWIPSQMARRWRRWDLIQSTPRSPDFPISNKVGSELPDVRIWSLPDPRDGSLGTRCRGCRDHCGRLSRRWQNRLICTANRCQLQQTLPKHWLLGRLWSGMSFCEQSLHRSRKCRSRQGERGIAERQSI